MKLIIAVTLFVVLLASCSPQTPDPGIIQTAIALTQTAVPTNTTVPPTSTPTLEPTSTPNPTNTPTSTDIPKPSQTEPGKVSIDDVRRRACAAFIDAVENTTFTDIVTLCRIGNGFWEIELRSPYSARDNQPDISYSVIQVLAFSFGTWDPDQFTKLVDGTNPAIHLVTYSVDGKYPYQSTTDFLTLQKINYKEISYEEWVQLSQAGFK